MCSEPTSDAPPAARCLLCNVGCPVRAAPAGPDRYLPDYVPHAGYAGLCGRGSVLVELLDHPGRVLEAHRHTPGGREVLATDAAARQVAETLRAAGSAAIFVDASADADAVAQVGQVAADTGAQWAVTLAASDAGLVPGLDGSGLAAGSFVGPEALAAADGLLVIGNAYATHPVAAHWLFEARTTHPRMRVFAITEGCGVTAEFAGAVYQPALAPGGAARAVEAMAAGQADGLGPDGQVLKACAEALAEASDPAIVVGADLGYADAQALGKAVARLAGKVGAKVCPLTTYGNAWGAMRAGAAAGAGCPVQILKSGPKALLVIGGDPLTSMGQAAAEAAFKGVEHLMYIGPMPTATSRRASLVVPSAFVFETAGRALLGPGREVAFEPLLGPPAGVPSLFTHRGRCEVFQVATRLHRWVLQREKELPEKLLAQQFIPLAIATGIGSHLRGGDWPASSVCWIPARVSHA